MCSCAGGYQVWKKSFFFAAIPIIILGHVNAFGMADESAHTPPEFVPYDHLRIRSKVPLILHLEHIECNIYMNSEDVLALLKMLSIKLNAIGGRE